MSPEGLTRPCETSTDEPASLPPDLFARRSGPLQKFSRLVAGNGIFWYVAAFVLAILIWQIVVWITTTPSYVLPTPVQVAKSIGHYHTVLVQNGWVTLRSVIIGFGISLVVGVLIAIPIAFSTVVERLAYPILVVTQAIPKIALGPVFLVWFGFGMLTNVIIAVSVSVFPIIVNTALGLTSIDPDMVRLGRSMGASKRRLFFKLRLPTALPSMFAGFKVAITLAVIGVVVGEFIAGGSGLGYLTLTAGGNQEVPLMFAAIIALSVLGLLTYGVIDVIERVLLRWHPSREQFGRAR